MADVLVLHEGWGRPSVDHIVDRLERDGFGAHAPDLFAPRSAWLAAPIAASLLGIGRGQAFQVADQAYEQVSPAAVIGLSLGAAMAVRRAWPVPIVAAYGHVHRRLALRAPALGVYGTADRTLLASGRRLERQADVRWYDGAGHSFLSTHVPRIGSLVGPHPAAEQAWSDIVEFLSRAVATDGFASLHGN
ncbi:MAG: dienelactone hydrolase family protein [Acidimicrobiia bacterium]